MREGIFTKDAPFKTVEEYTEWWLTKNGFMDLTKSAERLNEAFRKHHIKEVSLEIAVNIQVDIISVVESEINEDWWETSANAEQFLVRGLDRKLDSDETLYLQGYGWSDDFEGKRIQKQDAWLASLD